MNDPQEVMRDCPRYESWQNLRDVGATDFSYSHGVQDVANRGPWVEREHVPARLGGITACIDFIRYQGNWKAFTVGKIFTIGSVLFRIDQSNADLVDMQEYERGQALRFSIHATSVCELTDIPR